MADYSRGFFEAFYHAARNMPLGLAGADLNRDLALLDVSPVVEKYSKAFHSPATDGIQIIEIIAKSSKSDIVEFSANFFTGLYSGGLLNLRYTSSLSAELARVVAEHAPAVDVSNLPQFNSEKDDPRSFVKQHFVHAGDALHEGIIANFSPELHAALADCGAFSDGTVMPFSDVMRERLGAVAAILDVSEETLKGDAIGSSIRNFLPPVKTAKGSFRAKIEAEQGQGAAPTKIPLPTEAPERWKGREDKSETPHAFIERVYATWLPGGEGEQIGRGLINRLDNGLYKALQRSETLENLHLSERLGMAPNPQKGTTEEEISNFRQGIRPDNHKDYQRIASAERRSR